MFEWFVNRKQKEDVYWGGLRRGGSILVYINLVYLVQWTEKHEMRWDA